MMFLRNYNNILLSNRQQSFSDMNKTCKTQESSKKGRQEMMKSTSQNVSYSAVIAIFIPVNTIKMSEEYIEQNIERNK